MKRYALSILFVFVIGFCFSQGVNWTNINDINDSIAKEKRPIIVKIETPWCNYCKLMDKKVYSKKRFAKRMGANYYFVKLNAASKDPILFNGKDYGFFWFTKEKGVHSLVRELGELDGVLRYPTTVVLNSDLTINKRIVGYLNKQDLKYWLEYSEEY